MKVSPEVAGVIAALAFGTTRRSDVATLDALVVERVAASYGARS